MAWYDPVVGAWERLGWWLGEHVPQPIQRALERVLSRARQLGRAAQTVVVTVLLFVLYVLGVGLTRLLVAVFARRYLDMYTTGPAQDSYWIDAPDYELDPERLHGQI
jgi:hypothetical protein